MSSRPDLDRRITAWLDAQAPMREPDGLLERVSADLAHTRRLPGWVIPERWLPMQTTARLGTASRAAITLTLVSLLLTVLAALVVAAQPDPAPPVGPARNGLIAFPADGDIWVVEPDGTHPRVLVATPGIDLPVLWSPTGTHVAFWSFAFDGDPTDPDAVEAALASPSVDGSVWVANADGSGARPLKEHIRWSSPCGLDLNWAHDGTRLAISHFATDGTTRLITILSVEDGSERTLVEQGVDPSWSPDDRTIAYHGYPHTGSDGTLGRFGVWLVGTDGSDDRQLSETNGSGCAFDGPTWSPDGTKVAYYGQADGVHDILIAATDGSGEIAVATDPADEYWPSWSPDGTRLAFERVVDAANNAPQFVVSGADGTDQVQLDHPLVGGRTIWSPDGRHLLGILLDESHTQAEGLILIDPDGNEAPLAIYHGALGQPDWQRLAP